MKWTITDVTNFLRIFQLPDSFPEDFCFAGGRPSTFTLVDWFNAFPQEDFWGDKTKEFDSADEKYRLHIEKLKEYIKGKKYYHPEYTYMVLTDYGDVFLVNPEKRACSLQFEYKVVRKKAEQAIAEGGR